VAIVGGGVAGLATAHALVAEGVRGVVLVERERQWGRHASGLNAAILRTVIDEPAVAELAHRSAQFFAAPPAGFAPVPLLRQVGVVLTADRPAAAAALERMARASRRPLEPLDESRLRAVAPFLATAALTAWHSPSDGVLDIAALLDGLARGAVAGGAELCTDRTVRGLSTAAGAVNGLCFADGSELRAETVVLAGGGWAERLGAAVGSSVRLEPRRRHLLVTAPDPRIDRRWPVVWNSGDSFYARPESGGWMMCACDESVVDADHCPVDASVPATVAAAAARHLPDYAAAQVAKLWCGTRTFAADRDFVIGPDAQVPGLFWVAGLGGHGMSTAPALGALAAAALRGGGDRELLRAFDPGRPGAQ
jgi:D-arginine dehydrogenase